MRGFYLTNPTDPSLCDLKGLLRRVYLDRPNLQKMNRILLILSAFLFSPFLSFSQCADGEVEVTLILHTDAWGYENYWQLRASGTPCGPDFIAEGANLNVGCAGTASGNSSNGYDNNATYTASFCVVAGESYDLIFVDSYGDGGLAIELLQDGVLTNIYYGGGAGNTWTFVAGDSNVPSYDMPCNGLDVIPDGPSVQMNNVDALVSIDEMAPPAGNCALFGLWCEGDLTGTVWAKFVAVADVAYEITTCTEGNGIDSQIALWRTDDCTDWSTFELISSNDDTGCNIQGYSSLMYASCLEPGATYYIQVDGWAGAEGPIAVEVNTFAGNPVLNAQVNSINCPLEKGQEGEGSIFPYIIGTGSDFVSTWTGPGGFLSAENYITDLDPGVYQLTASTSCGQVLTANYTINAPSPFNVIAQFVLPTCPFSENGEIEVNVTGGTPGYVFAWEGPDGIGLNGQDISNLSPGEYILMITDNNECEHESSYALPALDNLIVNLGPDLMLCQNFNDVEVISGPSGLNYEWQDGSDNQFFVINAGDLDLGSFDVILTASTDDGCVTADAVVVTIEICSGINEQEAERIEIYPNPSHQSFQIDFPYAGDFAIALLDQTGRVVWTGNAVSAQQTYRVQTNLSTGVYYCRVSGNDQSWSAPLIIE